MDKIANKNLEKLKLSDISKISGLVNKAKSTFKLWDEKYKIQKDLSEFLPEYLKPQINIDKNIISYSHNLINNDIKIFWKLISEFSTKLKIVFKPPNFSLVFKNIEVDHKDIKKVFSGLDTSILSKLSELIFEKSAKIKDDQNLWICLREYLTGSNLEVLKIQNYADNTGDLFNNIKLDNPLTLPKITEIVLKKNQSENNFRLCQRLNSVLRQYAKTLTKFTLGNMMLDDNCTEIIFDKVQFKIKLFSFRNIKNLVDSGQEAVKRAIDNPNLEILDISNQPDSSDQGITKFFSHFNKSNIKDLYINNIHIGNDSSKALNETLRTWEIEVLCLKNSLNNDSATQRLFLDLNLTSLTWLELSSSKLGKNGCVAINSAIRDAQLDQLELQDCDLAPICFLELFKGLDLCHFHSKASFVIGMNQRANRHSLKVVNTAIYNSGFSIQYQDLDIDLTSKFTQGSQNLKKLHDDLVKAQSRSTAESAQLLQVKGWPRDENGQAMDYSAHALVGLDFARLVHSIEVVNKGNVVFIARDGYDWYDLGTFIINHIALFAQMSKKLSLSSTIDILQSRNIINYRNKSNKRGLITNVTLTTQLIETE